MHTLLQDDGGDAEDVYGEVRGERGDDSDEDISDDEPVLGKKVIHPSYNIFMFS